MINRPSRRTLLSPDRTFEEAARKAGAVIRVLWEVWEVRKVLVGYQVNDTPVIVQTHKAGGWTLYTPCPTDVEQAIADALQRLGVAPS